MKANIPKKTEEPTKEPYLLFQNSINKDKYLVEPGFFKQTFITYTNKLVNIGRKTPLQFEHLFKMSDDLKYQYNSQESEKMIKKYQDQLIKGKLSFTDIVFKLIRKTGFISQNVAYCLAYFSQIPVPLIIKFLLQWLETNYEEGN